MGAEEDPKQHAPLLPIAAQELETKPSVGNGTRIKSLQNFWILTIIAIPFVVSWINSEDEATHERNENDPNNVLACLIIMAIGQSLILFAVYASYHRGTTKASKPYSLKTIAFLAAGSSIIGGSVYLVWSDYVVVKKFSDMAKIRPPFGKRAEEAFLSVPNSASAISASRLFATKPHMAGTPGDLTTAKDFLELLKEELGISNGPATDDLIFPAGSVESQQATRSIPKAVKPRAWIDTYYPVMNTPKDRNLQIVDDDGSVLLEANLIEISDSTDPDAGKYNDDVPTFHGLSRGGDVTGKLVDGNYCTQEDFEQLLKQKVEVNGSIVLCRYGGIFRGLKVKGGQELGAVGVLIYSDPRDDGTVTSENGYAAYPHGPARNPTSVQRGSVQYLSVYPGDPTTPGYPSYENSTRTEGSNIPLIPSLPISWTNAELLFRTLNSSDELHDKPVRLVNNVDTRVIPIWNTMGVIPGFIRDEVVVVGNHRDAWVMGAADPSSGTASVHEVIRGLGHLLRKGWKPLRTIVIASWDAEEYGLIGSTEWGEDFSDWIDEHVVAYLNLDSSVSGSRLRASGSPLLAHFIRDTAKELPHPTDSGRTLWDATNDEGKLFGLNGKLSISEEVLSMHEMQYGASDEVGVSPLGSGSDYTVFLQRNGIPSTNGGFGATLHDPVYHYHSIFDSERWQGLYADPGFFRHVAVAKHLGLQTLRLASSAVLPFNATHYAYEIESYLKGVEAIASQTSLDVEFKSLEKSIHSLQKASVKLDEEKVKAHKDLMDFLRKIRRGRHAHRRIEREIRRAICRLKRALGRKCSRRHRDTRFDLVHTEPSKSSITPAHQDTQAIFSAIPDLVAEDDWSMVEMGMIIHEGFDSDLDSTRIDIFGGRKKHILKKLRKIVKRIQAVNKKTAAIEKGFISEDGIKDREWYKHLAVAPGKWLGYGATTLPALTEAITFEKNATLAQQEAKRLEDFIHKIVDKIKV